jgi:exopolyphosphatase/guanosine-5'-triphosphate,3'-diphosphate pyrophosphatase
MDKRKPTVTNYAAIDIGTNSAHLAVASVNSDGVMKILDQDKVTLRLGDAFDSEQNITEEAIERTIAAVQRLKEISSSYNPHFRCVATHAIRSARNSHDLINRVKAGTGIAIETIDGTEEARLIALAMQDGFSSKEISFLGVDIGGGSTEFVVSSKNDTIDFVSSIKLGAVVLSKKFLDKKSPTTDEIELLKKHIKTQLAPLKAKSKKLDFSQAYISSGTAKALASIDALLNDREVEDFGGYVLSKESLDEICKKLEKLKAPKKIKQAFNLDENRSEIILAGSIILRNITNMFSVPSWHYSPYGLREGIVIDTFRRLKTRPKSQQAIPTDGIRWQNVRHLAKRLEINEKHSRRVLRLTQTIYDKLNEITPTKDQLTAHLSDRELLEFASWLHEGGKFVSFSKYQKHSQYLINSSKLMGFTQEELEFIGRIARYHRKGIAHPNRRDCVYLSKKSIARVNFLAGILRISSSLSRTRQDRIKDITIELRDNTLCFVIEAQGQHALHAELHKLTQEKKTIEASLGMEVMFAKK